MANHYEIGNLIRVTGTFTDSDGNAHDPTSVFCSVLEPDGTQTDYEHGVDPEITNSATGVYYLDQAVDQEGFWYYRWYATGTGEAADESYFRVRARTTT